jgi:hypothetical protein
LAAAGALPMYGSYIFFVTLANLYDSLRLSLVTAASTLANVITNAAMSVVSRRTYFYFSYF